MVKIICLVIIAITSLVGLIVNVIINVEIKKCQKEIDESLEKQRQILNRSKAN